MTVYEKINSYRLTRGMSMQAFADEIGLPPSTVRRALYGIHRPHDYHAVAFDDYYKKNRDKITAAIGSTV